VCFSNYKFFILFLGYSLFYCIYVALTSLQYFVGFWTGIGEGRAPMTNLHIVFLFFAGVMFAISLISLFGYHCFLVSRNKSTLEAFQTPIFVSGPDKDGFNLGCQRNFVEVFGHDRRYWLLPTVTSQGDGLTYPVRTVDEDYDSLLGSRQRWTDEADVEEGTGFHSNSDVRKTSQHS
jgi:palmitoyltransferase